MNEVDVFDKLNDALKPGEGLMPFERREVERLDDNGDPYWVQWVGPYDRRRYVRVP